MYFRKKDFFGRNNSLAVNERLSLQSNASFLCILAVDMTASSSEVSLDSYEVSNWPQGQISILM